MANKLLTTYNAVHTAIETLVAGGHLRGVRQSMLVPSRDSAGAPLASVLPSRSYRSQGKTWVMEIGILALARHRDQVDAVLDLMARLDDAIETLSDAGTAGGQIHNPTWDWWYDTTGAHGSSLVGCMGGLRCTVTGPILTD